MERINPMSRICLSSILGTILAFAVLSSLL